jgi:uncharacterized protein
MRKTFLQIFLPLMLGFVAGDASAARFNCAAAYSKVDIMLCADQGLAQLDEKMRVAYALMHKAPREQQAEQAMQLAWLRTRNACKDAE